MCGICGAIWNQPELAIDAATLQRMTDVLSHRGPDDAGTYLKDFQTQSPYEPLPGVALGFRRLSIIDLETGHQPLSNEDGSIWVVFNGEIYNYQTLRKRLEGAGHQFKTNSDTETIVHLYEERGEDFVHSLNGMFAIAIWDSNRRKLILARDRLGQKPLFYTVQNQRIIFASELKSILQHPSVRRELDPNAIDEYLTYQYVPHPNTIFHDIQKIAPGHLGVYQDGKFALHRYWNPDFQQVAQISQIDAQEQLSDLLRSAVKMRMRSDVPLGAFLSGGVDSSLIVALMQEQSEQQIKTFSIGFPVKSYDETRYAKLVAEHLGTEHRDFQVTPDAVEILPQLVRAYDEPFADSSAIPTWYVSQLTRQHVTVALSGDGGDELFAGYPRYAATRLGQWIDRTGPLKNMLAARCWQMLPGSARQKGFIRRLKRFNAALGMSPLRRYLEWICIFNETGRAELYHEDFLEKLTESDPFDFLQQAWDRTDRRDRVTATCLTDLQTYLPCDLNTKVDIASMSHSLECRQPFLDFQLVEFAASLPIEMKFRYGKGKRILRSTFGKMLPSEIWTRRKMGFGVPLDQWFRHELKEMAGDILLAERTFERGFFRRETVERLWNDHQNKVFDHSYRLWSLLFFELWLREWID
jgi:asparagine synthase (glutamine-hydrolysing)